MSENPAAYGPISVLFDLPHVTIRHRWVSEMHNNVYLLTSKTTGLQVLIDAADEAEAIVELIDSARQDTPCETKLSCVITTHQHWDHIRALPQIVEKTGAATASGVDDASDIERQSGVKQKALLEHDETAQFDGFDLKVIGLRGHTPGSIGLALSPEDNPCIIFSGDSLFPGGVGNTWDDPERFNSLFNDVVERIFDIYDDDTVVLPGHGDFTTLGAERPHLSQWRERGW